MTLILITPWLAAIVGAIVFTTSFAITYPFFDQYSDRNHYLIPYYELKGLRYQGTLLKDLPTNDAIISKQIIEKWSPLRAAFDHDVPHKIEFSRLEDGNNNNDVPNSPNLKKNIFLDQTYDLFITYISKAKKDSIKKNSRKIKINNKIFTDNKKDIFNIQTNKKSWVDFENSLHKRSSASLEKEEEGKVNKEEIVEAMSLQELLKYWGIDTSDEKATVRSQRGDIEITEVIPVKSEDSLVRGDVPSFLLNSDSLVAPQRRKRDVMSTGRKLLWAHELPKTDMWGFAENDGLLLNDQESYESNERSKNDEPEHFKGNHHYGRHHHPTNNNVYDNNHMRQLRERQRIQEEERRQWEDLERKRDEERQRRIEDEQRKNDVEQERRDDEQRRKDEEQQRRDEEQQRKEDEERKNEQERRRNNGEQQQDNRGQRRNDFSNNEYNQEDSSRQTFTNKNNTHEARMRQWQRLKEEHDRLIREKEKNRNQAINGKSLKELENERKLQDYIRRNTPIVVGNKRNHNHFQVPASLTISKQKKTEDPANRLDERRLVNTPEKHLTVHHKRIEEERKHPDPQRGQYEEQIRTKQEEYRRQQEQKNLHVFPNERVHNVGEERRYDSRNKNQPSNESEKTHENEALTKIKNQRRLHDEQRRRLIEEQNNRYQEQRRENNQEFRGIKVNPRDRNPSENQHYVSPFQQSFPELARTIHNEQTSPMRQSGIFKSHEPIKNQMQNQQYRVFQQPILPNEALEKKSDNIKDRYHHPDNQYHLPQANVQENPGYHSTRNRPESTVSKSWWGERSKAMTPVEIENRRISIERKRQEEARQRQNEASHAIKTNKTYERLQGKLDQRNNAERKGWPVSRQDIPKENQKSQLQEQRQREDETKERYLEFKENNNNQFPIQNERMDEEARLRNLPVSATIVIRNISRDDNNDTNRTTPIEITARDNFGNNNIDFPGISPHKKGIEVQHFQRGPVIRRPPVESPKACIWSIVICCGQSNIKNSNRLRQCFEGTDCPGANWDTDRCSEQKIKTANKEIMQFYLREQQSNGPTSFGV